MARDASPAPGRPLRTRNLSRHGHPPRHEHPSAMDPAGPAHSAGPREIYKRSSTRTSICQHPSPKALFGNSHDLTPTQTMKIASWTTL